MKCPLCKKEMEVIGYFKIGSSKWVPAKRICRKCGLMIDAM